MPQKHGLWLIDEIDKSDKSSDGILSVTSCDDSFSGNLIEKLNIYIIFSNIYYIMSLNYYYEWIDLPIHLKDALSVLSVGLS